jgi:glutamate/tyrosine decarboxylase-like PLP-dependent enzyme
MHTFTDETAALADAIQMHTRQRLAHDQPVDRASSPDALTERVGVTITPEGIGGEEALRIWAEVLEPSTLSTDHPAYLAFVPGAPTKASVLFDVAISASATYAGTWIEGAGAVWAENQVLGWLAALAGMPAGSGGCFVSGGTAGNLSALVAARHAASMARGGKPATGWRVAVAESTHPSVASAARVMDVELLSMPVDDGDRLVGESVRVTLAGRDDVFAVVASAGSTNAGVIDDLEGIATACEDAGVWLHVDGAYGGAGLLVPSIRDRFRGLGRADSFIVDPHKWLFAPYDACALLYRDPAMARSAHRQEASYLDSLNASSEWNPSDFAHHLSRRARGLPLWFSLATYGADAYRDAVEAVFDLTRRAATEIRSRPYLELALEPNLSVVLFRRNGWSEDDYERWWRRLLDEQIAFVQPTLWRGEKVARLCFVNPRTSIEHVRAILDPMG